MYLLKKKNYMYDHQDKTTWSNNWICKIAFYTKLLEV